MSTVRFAIPDGLEFSQLQLRRESVGAVSVDTGILGRIVQAAGLEAATLTENDISGLIMGWYFAHTNAGGAPDQTAEDLIAEALAEDAHGGGFSHAPGRA